MKQKKYISVLIILIIISVLVVSVFSMQPKEIEIENRYAFVQTNVGNFTIELYENITPKATRRFIELANNGFYVDTIIHRIFENYAIYGGQYLNDSTQKPYPYDPLPIETDPLVKHTPGAVSLLRTADDQTKVGCQFLICLDNISSLDEKNTIVGYVIDGLDVVFKISIYPKDNQYGDGSGRIMFPFDVWIEKITILTAEQLEKMNSEN